MSKKKTKEEFIEDARKVHGNKYDYSKVEYENNNKKVCIICHEKDNNGIEHGEFWQIPNNHLNGCGCRKCSGNNPLTTVEFIEKAKEIHDGKYDYSKVNYINAYTKVSIICPEHGEFLQSPREHLKGQGCPICAGNKKMTTEQFIEEAKSVHNDKYDYSKVEYINSTTKVCIICPEHGEFWQTPIGHLSVHGCPECGKLTTIKKRRKTTEQFIEEAKSVHNDKYDYSKVNYINSQEKVCIICPEHGEFWQTPSHHLQGHGCSKCSNLLISENMKLLNEEFIDNAKKMHGDKYDYSKVEYKDYRTKVCIICPVHGEFWQTPTNHLCGEGCPQCGLQKRVFKRMETNISFIEKANIIHNYGYNYDKIEYNGCKNKICIICPEHGEFWQTPDAHINGEGCPKCKSSHLENEMRLFLTENNIKFKEQYKDLWLGLQSIDFYLPDYKVGIECQGEQHFKPIKHFGGENGFRRRKNGDIRKAQKCKDNGIRLLYYSNLGIEYPYKVFEDKHQLLDNIINEATFK